MTQKNDRGPTVEITIRPETPGDVKPIHDVTVAAFLNAPHADHTEQYVVQALRASGALTISLVAEGEGEVVGHVAVSPVTVSDGTLNWYGLGPVSVSPQFQGNGIGTQLIINALTDLKESHAHGCVVLGDPDYYGRFGFKPVDGLILPDVPPEYFMALSFFRTYPQGSVSYNESFSATS